MKALLLFFVFVFSAIHGAPPLSAERDITPLLTSATWKWDHPAAKGRSLKFRGDGTCEATLWKGVWKITAHRHVEITLSGNNKVELDFNEAVTEFTGTHTDGLPIVGKRQGEVPASLK